MGLFRRPAKRVVVVDDSRVMQAMVENAFTMRRGYTVVAVASDAQTGAELVRSLRPDIVTVDLCMPDLDGAKLLEMIADVNSVCKVIVSDLVIKNAIIAVKLAALGASQCLSKRELVDDPDAFFKKIEIARAKLDAELLERAARLIKPATTSDIAPPVIVAPTFGYPIPVDEPARLEVLRRKDLLNAVRERHFDLITQHVARLTSFPICQLTFIGRDQVWIKSSHGLEGDSAPREIAFCAYTIAKTDPLVVENAAADIRFADGPAVTELHLHTYVGQPIVTRDGTCLGAICVLDTKPRSVSRTVTGHLATIAELVAEIIEVRPTLAA